MVPAIGRLRGRSATGGARHGAGYGATTRGRIPVAQIGNIVLILVLHGRSVLRLRDVLIIAIRSGGASGTVQCGKAGVVAVHYGNWEYYTHFPRLVASILARGGIIIAFLYHRSPVFRLVLPGLLQYRSVYTLADDASGFFEFRGVRFQH